MGGGIGGLLQLNQAASSYYYLYDGKGNVTSVVDGTGSAVAGYRYDTFGKVVATSGTLDQPFQFSTKRFDSQTGLNYYGYRFYNPGIERWMNRDPLVEAGGINLYGFVENDPVNRIDPMGLFSPQKEGCDSVPEWVETGCRKRCCKVHDDCYTENRCSSESWEDTCQGKKTPCAECNTEVFKCWTECAFGADHMDGFDENGGGTVIITIPLY